MSDTHADIRRHVKLYIGVFAALAILTILTVIASRINVSQPAHVTIALSIALLKATLVAAIFMHLKWEKGAWIWIALAFCAVFFVVLMCVPVLTASDMPVHTKYGTWG